MNNVPLNGYGKTIHVNFFRWKSENECFNVMKNHGYCMEHSYGHGKNNMAFNFYLLTLLAFFMHQIFELTDRQYQACRSKLGSKKHLWETIRSYIKIIVFDSWELLLEFVLSPVAYKFFTENTLQYRVIIYTIIKVWNCFRHKTHDQMKNPNKLISQQ